jgi:hypothetical protein
LISCAQNEQYWSWDVKKCLMNELIDLVAAHCVGPFLSDFDAIMWHSAVDDPSEFNSCSGGRSSNGRIGSCM